MAGAAKLYGNSPTIADSSAPDDQAFDPEDYDWSTDKQGNKSGQYNAKRAAANAAKKRSPAEQKAYDQMQKDVDDEAARQKNDPTGKPGS